MWSNEALNLLVDVRNLLIQEPSIFDPYWNASDNIGLVMCCLYKIKAPILNKILYYSNTEYVQCNWNKIFLAYHSDSVSMNWDLEIILHDLFKLFTYEQLLEINNATEPDKEYDCFLSFLNGVIVNNSQLVA